MLGLALLASCAVPRDAGKTADHAQAFDRLKTLAGEYEIAGAKAPPPVVGYHLIAGASALLEQWKWANGAEELTVFFMDGGTLRATHYCHSGIQSTMALQDATSSDLVFRITAATNLPSPAVAHISGFAYRFDDNARILRTEEWSKDGKVSRSQDELVRRARQVEPGT